MFNAEDYQRFRPDYPPALFEWLAGVAPTRRLAIDVGTGNGQAAVGLARHFDRVIATEPSAEQLRSARVHPHIEYRIEPAESLSAETGSADLVVAAQAAHWLDWPRFNRQAQRVLAARGVLAIWCYERCQVAPAVDRLIDSFYRDVVGPYWPRERRQVEEGYRDLPLPVPAMDVPRLAMQAEWDARAMLGYLGTWSAVRRYRARTGRDPLALVTAALESAWGAAPRRVQWPLSIKAGRA